MTPLWRILTLVFVLFFCTLGCVVSAAAEGELQDLGVEPELVVGPPLSAERSADVAEVMAESIAGRMRCPVCQGLSVGDSPTEAAQHMYDQIRDLAALGFSEDQIFDYFEESYGEFIRLEPRFEGITLWVWLLPVVVVLLGAVWLLRLLRSRTSEEPAALSEQPDDEEEPEELRSFLEKVRAETRPDAAGA